MKTSNLKTDSQKLVSTVQTARLRVATAENRWQAAKQQARSAKRRRKEIKLIARRARKQAKQAKADLADAREALAKAEAKLAQSGPRRKKPVRQAAATPQKKATRSTASAAAKSAKPKRWSRPRRTPGSPARPKVGKSQPQSTEPLDLATPVALPAAPGAAEPHPGGVEADPPIHPTLSDSPQP